MELQDVFYWMAIVYMTIMFIFMVAALVAVFAIKKKIDHIHQIVDEKIQMVTNIAQVGSELVAKAKDTFNKHA